MDWWYFDKCVSSRVLASYSRDIFPIKMSFPNNQFVHKVLQPTKSVVLELSEQTLGTKFDIHYICSSEKQWRTPWNDFYSRIVRFSLLYCCALEQNKEDQIDSLFKICKHNNYK